MLLQNSKSAKICVNENDYLALIDAASDILSELQEIRDDPGQAIDWTLLDNLENALTALGEI